MKVFNKIFFYIFLFLGINLYSQNNSNYKKGVSNILNAQNPNDIGVRSASQIQEDKDDPLEYGYVNDKDIFAVSMDSLGLSCGSYEIVHVHVIK